MIVHEIIAITVGLGLTRICTVISNSRYNRRKK